VNARVAALLVGPGAKRLQAIEEQAKRRFWLVPRKDAEVEHFAVLAQGARSKLAPSNGLEEGAEVRVELGEVGLYDPDAGVGRVDGHAVVVGDAAKLVGKKVKVRIERVLDGVAYASLLTQPGQGATAPAPVTAELEAVKPTRQPPRRRPSQQKSPAEEQPPPKRQPPAKEQPPAKDEPSAEQQPDAVAEEQPETVAEGATAGEAEKPKRKTRRGSRGGRRRRKPATATATSGPAGTAADGDGKVDITVAADGNVEARIHVPEPDLGKAGAEAPDVQAEASSQNGTEAEGAPTTPRRRTRRGSRGGRNRRKKPAAATEKAPDS
jgi:predicted RNA-binding protein with TRAM domain